MMTKMILANIITNLNWWISKNPSYVSLIAVVALVVLVTIVYLYNEAKNQQSETYADYLRMYDEYSSKSAEISSLKSEAKTANKQLNIARKEIAKLEKQLNKELDKNVEIKGKYEVLMHDIGPLRMQLGKTQKRLESLASELESSKAENQELQHQISVLETIPNEKALLEEKISVLDNLNAKTRTDYEELKDKYDTVMHDIAPLRMQLGKAQKNILALQDKIKIFNSKIEELQTSIDNKVVVLTEKEHLIVQYENRIKELEEAIYASTSNKYDQEELEEERDLLSKQLEEANSDREKTGKQLNEQRELAETRGKEIERLNEELRKANKSITALNAKVQELLLLQNSTSEEGTSVEEKQLQSEEHEGASSADNISEESPSEYPINDKAEEVTTEAIAPVNTDVATAKVEIQPTKKGRVQNIGKHIRPTEEEDEDVDLPIIENTTGSVKRSILQVVDVEQELEVIIDSDEFFSRSSEEIESVTRMLAEAAESGREAYLCACCRTPVKISKRDLGSREVLFFSHCTHDVSCDWKQEHSSTIKLGYLSTVNANEGDSYDYKAKYREIKKLIADSLQTEKSQGIGISRVETDKKIRSKYKFICHRTAGIYARYKNRDIVIELQTNDVLMNTVVNKDIFYRLNDHNVIWVFGANEGDGYNYIRKHVQRNTMFANKRNVFIMDKEAMEACKERQELVLKCNYLDPNGLWHYRKNTTGNNGILITLADLQFDEEMCKPYYFDANKDYFKLKPDIEKKYLDSIVSREKLLKDLQDTWEGKIAERRKKFTREKEDAISPAFPEEKPYVSVLPKVEQPIVPISAIQKEEPVKKYTGYNDWYIYSLEGKSGIVDSNDKFIVPCVYTDIAVWTRGKYRVKKIDQWGVIDESGNLIVDIEYKEISKLDRGKALVKNTTESFFIDENGNRIADRSITLQNGWIKFKQGNQWGIKDSKGKVIVDCIYDEIGSFRGRLVGFYKGTFQKLTTRFEYRMKITCRCINNDDNRANYEINGVKLQETSKKTADIFKSYDQKQINNISFVKNIIYISNITERQFNSKLDHIDQDSDFRLGEEVCVTIERIKMKKFFAVTQDGRKTYFTRGLFRHARKDYTLYHLGSQVKIRKVDFDSNVERTIWELI